MQQSTTVAVIVVVTFGAGFFVGRASVGQSAPTTVSGPVAMAPAPMAEPQRPFPLPSAPPPTPGSTGASAPQAMPPMGAPAGPMAAPPMMAGPAAALGSAPGGAGETVAGKLEETIQVPNFTYLRLATPRGDEWAAIPTNNGLQVGQQVTLAKPMKMVNFTSKTLNRTFDAIWFGELGSAQ